MGASELWTGDNSLYRFTESTSLNPKKGCILVEQQSSETPLSTISHSNSKSENLEEKEEKSSTIYSSDESDDSAIGMDQQTLQDEKPKSSVVISMVEKKDQQEQKKRTTIDASLVEDYPLHLRYAFMVSSLCNNSSISYSQETKEWKSIGDPTEVALVVASQKGKLGRDYWEAKGGFQKIHERAFDSERKLMSVVYQQTQQEKEAILLCKGAPEELMRKCKFYHSPDEGQDVAMDDNFADKVSKESSRMACSGLRVLGLAYRKTNLVEQSTAAKTEVNNEDNGDPIIPAEYEETGLTFVGLIGLIDPPKQGVKEAIETCQEAGIRVMMITGDHVKTAAAIATQLGIFDPKNPDKVVA